MYWSLTSQIKNCAKPEYRYHHHTTCLRLTVLTVITQRQIHQWQGEDVDKSQIRKHSTMCRGYEVGESKTEIKPIGTPMSIFLNFSFDNDDDDYLLFYSFQFRRIFRDWMLLSYFEKQLRRNSLQLQSFDSFCCLTWLQR